MKVWSVDIPQTSPPGELWKNLLESGAKGRDLMDEPLGTWRISELAINSVLAMASVLAATVLSEYIIRRRERKQQEPGA